MNSSMSNIKHQSSMNYDSTKISPDSVRYGPGPVEFLPGVFRCCCSMPAHFHKKGGKTIEDIASIWTHPVVTTHWLNQPFTYCMYSNTALAGLKQKLFRPR